MRMVIFCVLTLCVVFLVMQRNGWNASEQAAKPAVSAETNHSAITSRMDGALANNDLSLAERRTLSDQERLQWLEKNGIVPANGDWHDCELAQKTTWWGKRLDPQHFWSNRVVWLDAKTASLARRLGRAYPPIPIADPSLLSISDDDITGSNDLDAPNVAFIGSLREMDYWTRFRTAHPWPPEDIENMQFRMAESILSDLIDIKTKRNIAKRTQKHAEDAFEQHRVESIKNLSLPPEALTREATQWSYVFRKRQEFAEFIKSAEADNETARQEFFAKVYVDRTFITEPLTPEQLQEANAWKVAYLRRLRAQKTDESYINAYLQAWGLDAKAVFSDP